MTRNEMVVALVGRIENGDVEAVTRSLQVITFAGWQQYGYSATAESKAEYDGYGWKGGDIKILANFAKRTKYRELSVKELNHAIKRLPAYGEQIAELLAKPGYYDQVVAAFAPKS